MPKFEPASGETIIKTLKPALRSVWFLIFGLHLGPAVMLLGRDPDGHPAKWIALILICLGIMLHRLSHKYLLTDRRLVVVPWWGLSAPKTLRLENVGGITVSQGFGGRLSGTGHLWVSSLACDEAGCSLMGLANPRQTADELAILMDSIRARGAAGSGQLG